MIRIALLLCLACVTGATSAQAIGPDPVAERMLQVQTASGGWPKHLAGRDVVYTRAFDAEAEASLAKPGRVDDATIDNDATTREIVHLATAWQRTGHRPYRDAAVRGVDYLLGAQYANGGWPQFYPDTSGYRSQVTFNDDAMTQVVALLQDIAEGQGALAALTPLRGQAASDAVARAITLILDLQVRIDGTPTIWAAQYDARTLVPAMARSYELASLATAESAGIVRLLMRQPQPSPRIVAAIEAACAWLAAHGLADTAVQRIGHDGRRPRDVRLVTEPGAVSWARFYDLERQQPLLADRGGRVVASLAELSIERRTGYAWYGTWPHPLLTQALPQWRQQLHGREAGSP